MLGPLLQKQAIWRHETPPQNISEWKEKLVAGRAKWGQFFADPEQCDLLTMLPVNDEERVMILNNMQRASKLRDSVRACTGASDTDAEHRQQCMECVCLYKPDKAKPFY